MPRQQLKLKQASAVLQVRPKELQNLVQFGVLKPKLLKGTHVFDSNTLSRAKIALCLKRSLGPSTNTLSKMMNAFGASEEKLKAKNPKHIVFSCEAGSEVEEIKLQVPFRAINRQIRERMDRAGLFKDLPRGRKRRGWKKEFRQSLAEAAKDMGKVSEEEILRTIHSYRRERRAPKITVAVEGRKRKAARRR